MIKNLIILGASGNAYDVLDIVETINADRPTWNVLGFLDDGRPAGERYARYPILGRLCEANRYQDCQFINAIGSDKSFRSRGQIVASTGLSLDRFATLIHPLSSVSRRALIGCGVYVNFGVSVGGGVAIGDHVALGPGCIVGHDSTIDAFTMIAPGAVISGFVQMGRCCYIGARAAIRQRVAIGEQALIGMGAVVLRNVEARSTVVGNPAHPLHTSGGSVNGVAAQLVLSSLSETPAA